MALTDIETEVLRQVDEDLTATYNWSGEIGLREALGDALDEICFFGNYFEQDVMVPLKEDVAIYSFEPDNANPLYIKSARLWESDRELSCSSLIKMSERDAQWLISRGLPIS